MLEHLPSGALPFVDRTLRLLQPELSTRAAKWRFALVVGLVLLIHAAVVGALLLRGADDVEPQLSEEVPIEVVQEIPAPPPEPPPKPEEKKPEPKQKQEQPKPKYEAALKPAFDAPRAPNQEKVEREAPEKETHAPQPQAQAPQLPAEAAAQPDTPKIAALPAPARQEQANQPNPDEDRPDAEALNKAELQSKEDKKKANAEAAKTKKPLPVTDQRAAMARQLAALAPTPDYTLGSKSKPAIVSGGTENTTYLSVLYGLIMKKMINQNAMRSSPGTSVIFFALDDDGNLIHQAVEKTSGFPDIDQQTMSAIKNAAPFPPPPRDIPHRFFFSRDVERGR